MSPGPITVIIPWHFHHFGHERKSVAVQPGKRRERGLRPDRAIAERMAIKRQTWATGPVLGHVALRPTMAYLLTNAQLFPCPIAEAVRTRRCATAVGSANPISPWRTPALASIGGGPISREALAKNRSELRGPLRAERKEVGARRRLRVSHSFCATCLPFHRCGRGTSEGILDSSLSLGCPMCPLLSRATRSRTQPRMHIKLCVDCTAQIESLRFAGAHEGARGGLGEG
jgi:hypothetical protein